MQDLTLYPSPKNLKLAIATGIGTMAVGFFLPFLGDTATVQSGIDMTTVGYAANLAGLWFIGRGVMGLYRPRAVFHATKDGFSVNGKKMRPWSEYRGVAVHSMSYAFIGLGKFLRVKVGKSVLGGYVQINPLQLSGPAKTMAYQIDEVATAAKAAEVHGYFVPPVGSAMDPARQRPVRPAQAARPSDVMPQPVAVANVANAAATLSTFTQRLQSAGESPVQSVPSLKERLLGRRKVI